jgi:hypothetical protein
MDLPTHRPPGLRTGATREGPPDSQPGPGTGRTVQSGRRPARSAATGALDRPARPSRPLDVLGSARRPWTASPSPRRDLPAACRAPAAGDAPRPSYRCRPSWCSSSTAGFRFRKSRSRTPGSPGSRTVRSAGAIAHRTASNSWTANASSATTEPRRRSEGRIRVAAFPREKSLGGLRLRRPPRQPGHPAARRAADNPRARNWTDAAVHRHARTLLDAAAPCPRPNARLCGRV